MHVLLQDVRDNKAEAASAAPQALRLCQMVRFIICCHKRQTCQCYATWCCCPLAAMTLQPVTARLSLLNCDFGWEIHVLFLKVSKMDNCVGIAACFMLMRHAVIHSLPKIDLFSHYGAVLVWFVFWLRANAICRAHMVDTNGMARVKLQRSCETHS